MDQHKQLRNALLQPFLAIVLGLAAGAVVVSAVGASILDTYQEMWNGAFGSLYFTMSTLARSTPILLIGLGLALAFRAGVFNLGGEGQMVLGALSAALVGLYLPGLGAVKLIAAIVTGMVAGGLWSLLAGYLEARFNIQLLISTLLFNYIAVLFAGYLASEPFQDKTGSAALAQTAMLEKSVWLPKLVPGMSLHAGFLFGLAGALAFFLLIRYTSFGYEVKMMGHNPFFARYGGIPKTKVMLLTMFVSGGFAGLAGTVEVLGAQYRFVDGALTVPGYAWTGLMATLLANGHPIGVVFASILLAALQTGAMGVERNSDVPLEIASIIQAVLILSVSAKITLEWWARRKKGGATHGAV